MRPELPTGTVTFLFTDVEGSTRLLHELGAEAYAEALAEHRRVIREACAAEGGVEVDTQGDAFFFAFPTAPSALAASVALTEALADGDVRVRVGVHTGTPLITDEGYVGEDVHVAARLAAAGHGGQVLVSAATAELAHGAVTHLGAHRLKDIDEPVSIFQLGDGAFAPLRTVADTNLPTPVSSFVGREGDLSEADAVLRQSRLLTVTGPGGAGKTRFALELARRAREERFADYPGGVFACFLASLRDPTLVLPTIAQTLAVAEQPGRTALDALAAHLGSKPVLLLLDNLEHLLDAARELAQLLERASGLTLLVTSREVLRLAGETIFELPPLAEEEGVALFCERAQVEPTGPIREVCVRLEGLPLAIELAAARLRILTAEQLLDRLSQRLDLLKAGRDADPRQQTLRATMEWSHDLLTPDEQQLFARLAVFEGGCTLEAAEEVADADLDTLQSLVEKSLVRVTDGRYWMLATIREYAAERLSQSGQTDALRQRHADAVLELAGEAEAGLAGPESGAWLARLEAEHANLRAALRFLGETGRPERQLELIVHTGPFWCFGGRWVEGLAWLEGALSQTPDERDLRRAEALRWAASIALSYDWDRAATYAEQSLELARELDDPESVMHALKRCAWAAARQGRLDEAAQSFEELMETARTTGDEWEVALATLNLGALALDRGDYKHALALADDGLADLRRLGRADLVPVAALNRSHSLVRVGAEDDAVAAFRDAVAASSEVHNSELLTVALGHGAALALRRGDADAAARSLGAAAAARERLGTSLYGAEEQLEHATAATCRAELGDERFEQALAEGRTVSLEDALAAAVEAL